MEEGMITSVEPGIYRPGKWGVRIENLVLNVPAEKTEFGDFLKFETQIATEHAHEGIHLVAWPLPILSRECIQRERLQT